jgi:hypothetical protein
MDKKNSRIVEESNGKQINFFYCSTNKLYYTVDSHSPVQVCDAIDDDKCYYIKNLNSNMNICANFIFQ